MPAPEAVLAAAEINRVLRGRLILGLAGACGSWAGARVSRGAGVGSAGGRGETGLESGLRVGSPIFKGASGGFLNESITGS
jgi:hypothetical protein